MLQNPSQLSGSINGRLTAGQKRSVSARDEDQARRLVQVAAQVPRRMLFLRRPQAFEQVLVVVVNVYHRALVTGTLPLRP